MSSASPILVAAIGLTPHEQDVLRRIFILSTYRPRTYSLVPFSEGCNPHIVLIDGDDPASMAEWRQAYSRDHDKFSVPVVMVGSAANALDDQAVHVQRPFLAPHVLKTLDQLTPADVSSESKPEPPGRRVLVVDDSLPVRKQVELELKRFSIEADCAESGEQALEFLKNNAAYSAIFLDVIMPGVDGYSLCKAIKRDLRTKQIPIVMLTGKSSPFDRVRGKLSGCDSYLTKPVAREAFQTVVNKYLVSPNN